MQSFIGEYVLNVAVTGVLIGILESLLPEGKVRSAARLALGLVMLYVMAVPLTNISGITFTLDTAKPAIAQAQTERQKTYADIVRGVWERHVALDKAKEE